MPLIAWRRRPESKNFLARPAAAAAEGGSDRDGHEPSADSSPPQQQQRQHLSTKHHTTSGLFDTRVAAWMTDTGKADKALEFEALCVSWLKGEGSDAGEDRVKYNFVLLLLSGSCLCLAVAIILFFSARRDVRTL